MFLMLAIVGMSFDLGRIYIARNEGQNFVDASAMAAAAQLDGTSEGLSRARDAADYLVARWSTSGDWNLAARNIKDVVIEFSTNGDHWEAVRENAADYKLVRATVPENHVDITFLAAVGGPKSFSAPVHAVAGRRAGLVRLFE